MDDKRFEEMRQRVIEASRGLSPYGTSPSYGSSSGVDPSKTLGFLNKQTANDEEWKAGKAFYNGLIVQGGRGLVGALQMARDYNVYTRRQKDPNYRPMEEGMAILDNMEKASALQRYDIRGNSTLGQFGLDLTEGAGQLLGQVGASVLTGGAGGLAIMGTQIAGNQYIDLREQGVGVERAAIASLGNAAIQAPMERLSLGKMMKALPAGSTLKKKGLQVLESALTEGATEFLQQFPEEMANIYALNEWKDVRQMAAEFDRQFPEIVKEAAYSGTIGALLGGGGSSVNVAFERHAHNAQVDALQSRIDMERKSGVSADFIAGTVNTNLQGSTVAVDGETLLQYAQTKNPEEVAKALGVTMPEIEKAAEDGLSVDILQGNFEATELKMPGFLEAVRDDITFSDGGYSANKEKYQRLLQKETEQIQARDTELQEQLDSIFNNMRDAGVNKQTATAMMDMYRSVAVAADPYEPARYFREHPLEFRRDGDAVYAQAAMRKSEAKSMVDFWEETQTSGQDPNEKGKTFYSFATNNGNTIDIAFDDMLHFGNKHKLTSEQLNDIEASVDNIIDYEVDEKKKGHYGGKTVRAKINTPTGIAGVTFEYLGTGRVFMTTAFFDTEANIENWLNRKEGAGRSTLKNTDASFTSQPSISNIQQELGIVKNDKTHNKYNQMAGEAENKGGIGWDEAGKAIINLFSEADASTVIHESGHFFVENLGRDVNEGRATEQQQKDWQALLKYADMTNDEWRTMDMEGRRTAHERWAEGFESYIMEGKAPSRELRSVFRKFADWLQAIYKNFKRNTNAVLLNDDVRQVFDRMLASAEDIKEMERINGYFAKMPKVITDSLSESSKRRVADYMLKAEDKAVELLTKQSLVNFTDDRKERIAAFRADILPQVRDELSKIPLYSACADVEAYTMDTRQKAKTVARRYLNEEGKEYASWREELDAVQGDISDRLVPIIEQLQSGMNQGVAFVRDPETGKYVRHSNNDYWYSLWYKEHGRMLTKQDLRQLAYEVYTGERSDVLPGWENDSVEAGEYFREAKVELDELLAREQELLEHKDDVGKYRYRGLDSSDRITFDLLAERYGYSSGSELAQEIMSEPTLERAITLKADAMVQEAFPDIYKERALAEAAAKEAFYNDDTGLVIGLEQQLIEDKAVDTLAQERSMEARERLAQTRRQQANVAAKKELANMSVRDAVRTDRFIAAERKAAAQAAAALAKEDYKAALQYKNKQAFNHAMARESLRMKETVEQYKRYINRQFGAKKETWLNDEHFSQAAAIMQRMGYKRKDYDPYMRLQSLTDYAARMQELYDNVDIAGWILNEENSLRNPLQMTFNQFEDVVNALKNIKAIAKANKGDNLLGGAMDYATYTTDAESNLKKLKTKFKPVLGERQTAGAFEMFMASLKNTDNLFEEMDNSSYGFFSKTMGTAIKHGNDSEAIRILRFEKRTTQAYREWLPDKTAEDAAEQKVWYDELGASADKHTLTKMLMNLGNEGNARVLCSTVPAGISVDSDLWIEPGYGVSRDEAIEQTKANLLEFLGKVLTKEDIRYAQAKIDIAGMYWDEMAAMEKRTKGFAPRKVEALPVEMMLADGETVVFRGGYFPLMRDRQMGSSPQGQVPIADTDQQQGRNIRTLSTSNGNLKERVESMYPVDLNRGAEIKVMQNAIHDLSWRETMSDFRKLFNDEHMYALMKEKLGIAQMQAFREMLEKAAQPNGTASADLAETSLSQVASWMRRKTVNAAIMLNLKTSVQNFGNIFLYGRVVEGFGYSDVMAAMGNWHMNLQSAGNYNSMNELIMEKSVFMRERSELPDITLRDLRDEGKMNAVERKTVEWGTKMLVWTDNFTAKPIWLQAYMKKINSGASEQEAVDFADLIIRRTLGSSRITDVSSLQRGGKLFKLFTTFQGFFNTQFNQWVREANIDTRLWKEGKKGEAILNATTFVAAKWLVFCLVSLAMTEDPFEEDEDEWMNIQKELMHYPLSMMGPIGQAGNALLDRMLGMKSYGYRMSAIQSTIDSGLRTSGKIHKILADDDPWSDLIEPAAGLAGTVVGVPQQLNKWFFNAYDILFNDMDIQYGDLYRRRRKSER